MNKEMKSPLDAVKQVCEEFRKKYIQMLHADMDYCRFETLTAEVQKADAEMITLKAQKDAAYKSGDAKKALGLERQLASLKQEKSMLSEMLSEIDQFTVITRQDKIQFNSDLKAATDAAAAGELMQEISAAFTTIKTNAALMKDIVMQLYGLRDSLEEVQRVPCSIYYPTPADFDFMTHQIDKAAESIGMKD